MSPVVRDRLLKGLDYDRFDDVIKGVRKLYVTYTYKYHSRVCSVEANVMTFFFELRLVVILCIREGGVRTWIKNTLSDFIGRKKIRL